jgi:Ca2+-binding EF-hand superfamily protein
MSFLSDDALDQIARAAFVKVDTDGTNEIDLSELGVMLRGIANELHDKEPTKQDISDVMKQYDTDRSGQLCYSEFKILMKELVLELYS